MLTSNYYRVKIDLEFLFNQSKVRNFDRLFLKVIKTGNTLI